MTDENKGKRCKCCLGLGIIVLVLGVLSGAMGNSGFGLIQILAVVVGVAIILCGVKGTKFCKCCNK